MVMSEILDVIKNMYTSIYTLSDI